MTRFILTLLTIIAFTPPAHAGMNDYQKVRLRSLDKITARTMTFDARVGTTIKFGSMYIKILSCQKPDVSERDDAVAFLQIWEITPDDVSKWIFSGWMFASSPALSAMDHPIYDVWVMDCMDGQNDTKKQSAAPGPSIESVLQKTSTPPPVDADMADPSASMPPSDPPRDAEQSETTEQPDATDLPPSTTIPTPASPNGPQPTNPSGPADR